MRKKNGNPPETGRNPSNTDVTVTVTLILIIIFEMLRLTSPIDDKDTDAILGIYVGRFSWHNVAILLLTKSDYDYMT